jgi:hypothetical protein
MTKNILKGRIFENYETLICSGVLLSMIGIVVVSILRSVAFI